MWVILAIILGIGAIAALFGIGFWTAALIVAIIAGICIFRSVRAENKRHEEQIKKEQLYKDPVWRQAHPQEAAEIKLQIEAKQREEHTRKFGPAVCIDQIQAGHWDYSYWSSYANSAGGWSVKCRISNIGVRRIDYVNVTFAAIDAVGNKCYSNAHRYADAPCVYTGPLEVGRVANNVIFENIWYDVPLSRISVESIRVDFSDGTSQNIGKYGNVTNHGF